MSVLLKKPIFPDVSQKELAEQLEAKKKCQQKLPTWFTTSKIYYPNKFHIEQSSSEATARYKSVLANGGILLDLSGGFGVDSYYFADRFTKVIHCEKERQLSHIADYNFGVLQKGNVDCFAEDGIAYLQKVDYSLDWVYVDPSRRDPEKKRIFKLQDCEPNVLEHLALFFEKSQHIMLKTAPLLDIAVALQQLQGVKEIHVVALKDDVKELLWILERGFKDEPVVNTVNLSNDTVQHFSFRQSEEKAASNHFSEPLRYLYLPNAAILKAGAFKKVAETYDLNKLHRHSHLYTSNTLIDFPGKRFIVDHVLRYSKKNIRKAGISKANIAVRNFPKSVATLRRETGIKEGGDQYLFFTTNYDDTLTVVCCSKVTPDKAT